MAEPVVNIFPSGPSGGAAPGGQPGPSPAVLDNAYLSTREALQQNAAQVEGLPPIPTASEYHAPLGDGSGRTYGDAVAAQIEPTLSQPQRMADAWIKAPVWAYFDSLSNLAATASDALATTPVSGSPSEKTRTDLAKDLKPMLRDLADYYSEKSQPWQPQTGVGGFVAEGLRYGVPAVASMIVAPEVKAAQVAPRVVKAINTGIKLAYGAASDAIVGFVADNPSKSIQNQLRTIPEDKLLEAMPVIGKALLTVKHLSSFLALPDEAYDESGEIKDEWMNAARARMAGEQALMNPVGELAFGAARLVNAGLRRIRQLGMVDQVIGAARRAGALADEMLAQDPSLRTKSEPQYQQLRDLEALGVMVQAAEKGHKKRLKTRGKTRGEVESKDQKKARQKEEFEQVAGLTDEIVGILLKNIAEQGSEGARPALIKAPIKFVAAAIKVEGKVYTGVNHGEALDAAVKDLGLSQDEILGHVKASTAHSPSLGAEGFVDTEGQFYVRDEAKRIAAEAVSREAETEVKPAPSGKPPEKVFNLDRLETANDIKKFIDDTAEAHRPEIDAYRRGVRTHGDEIRDADLLGMTVDGVRQLTTLKADEMLRARQTLVTMAENIQALARTAAAPAGTDLDMVALRQAMTGYVAIQQHVKGLTTETARTLSAMRIAAKRTSASASAVDQFLGEWGGRDANKRLAENLAALNDLSEVGAVTTRAWNATTWDMMMEARKLGGLLTSPMTHVMNAASNATTTVTGVAEHLVAAGISSMRRAFSGSQGPIDPKDAIYLREVVAGVWGLWAGVGDGFKNAGHALMKGETRDGTAWKVDQGFRRAISAENVKRTWWAKSIQKVTPAFLTGENSAAWRAFDYIGEATRLSGRAILSIDELFKSLNYSAEVHRQAMRRAITDPGSASMGEAYRRGIENPAPDVQENAISYAQEMTFSAPPTGKLASLMATVRASDPGRVALGWRLAGAMVDLVVPFKTAPVNIGKYTFERVPGFNMLVQKSNDDISGLNGKAAQDMALAKLAIGSATIGTFAWMAANGRTTGGGPLDQYQRAQLEERTGWRPYSIIHDDGTTTQLQRLGPVGQMMGVGGDMMEVWSELDEKDRNQLAVMGSIYTSDMISEGLNGLTALGHGAMRNTLDQSPLTGVRDLITLMSDIQAGHGASGSKAFGSKIIASFAPFSGFTNWANAYFDDGKSRNPRAAPLDDFGRRQSLMAQTLRESLNRAKAKIPGLSQEVPARLGFWGQQVYRAPYLFENLLPFQVGQLKTDPAKLEALGMPANPAQWTDIAYPYNVDADRLASFIDMVGIDGELVRLGMPLGDHPKQIQGIPLNADQEFKYRRAVNALTGEAPIMVAGHALDVRGLTMREALDDLVREPWYVSAPDIPAADDDKPAMLRRVADHYRHDLGQKNEFGLAGADAVLYEADSRFSQSVERRAIGLEQLNQDAEMRALLGGQ